MSIQQTVQAAIVTGGAYTPPPLGNYFYNGLSTAWFAQSNPQPDEVQTRYPDGSYNQTLSFNTQTYTVTNDLGNLPEIEVDMWIYPTSTGKTILIEQGQVEENVGYHYVMLEIDVLGSIRARSWPQSGGSALISPPITMNAWHHIYFRHSNGTARLEVDGQLVGTDSYARTQPGNSFLGIGVYSVTGITVNSRFEGKVDSVKIRGYNFTGSTYAGTHTQYRPVLQLELDANNENAYNPSVPDAWSDTSGNSRNATLYGSPSYNNGPLKFFTFDRASLQYGQIPNIGNLPRFTAEAIFRLSEPYTNIRSTAVIATTFDLADDGNIDYGYVNYCIGTNGNAEFNAYWHGQFFDGAVWRQAGTGFIGYANTWFHAVVTYDGQFLRFYKNGTQVGANELYSSPQANGGPIRIGRRWDGVPNQSDNYFPGDISEVRLWSGGMSPGDVGKLYINAVDRGYPGI